MDTTNEMLRAPRGRMEAICVCAGRPGSELTLIEVGGELCPGDPIVPL